MAMSGGVDSSVSASLLKQQGFEVNGFFMKLPLPGFEEHLERVKAVANKLDVPLTVVDMVTPFTDHVMNAFITTYQKGNTPNPCIICNKHIKFGELRKAMQNKGMDKIATGHYAQVGLTKNGHFAVHRGLDNTKDQSYFLCRLDQDQLKHMVLPLGEKTKNEVYELAAEMNLNNVHGPESQDVCFLAGRSSSSFFNEQGIKKEPGKIVSSSGRILGKHRGLWHYTIGQRRGLGLPDATPWYVKSLDASQNQVIVCKHEELITNQALLAGVCWTDTPPSKWRGRVQIRGRHRPSKAKVEPVSDNHWHVTFDEPQRAVTPGQFAVFYEDDLIIGSGIIILPEKTEEGSD